MSKEIRLNAFAMNCVAHQSPGLWTHPRDRTAEYNRLPYWTDLAKTLERGRFDGLFLADVLGVYDVFGGSPDAALRNATQTPVNDPLLLISAMAAITENLGFGVTCTLSYEPPYPFARRMSTLDHLTEGRIGWNIVTGYLDSAARGAGKEKQTAHDDRYDVADEYMAVVYGLWEGSWGGGGAVGRGVAAGAGREPAEIWMFSMMTVILGPTEAEAAAKYADYKSHINHEGALTLMSGWTGVDFSTYDLDRQVRHVLNDAGRSAMDNITRADPDRVWTVREVAEHVGIGGIGPVLVGTPEKVADEIEAWFEQTGVDGLNMPFAISPGDFEDISDMLVPELTRRGRYKAAYQPGTLREKLFGPGRARLKPPHPAASYRYDARAAAAE